MWWVMLAQGAASAVKTGIENKEKIRQTKEMNRAAHAADRATVANAAQAISALNVQNAQLRGEAAQQLYDAEVAAYAATGSTVANAAAAGVKGASVDATVGDIQRELDEVSVDIEQNLEIQQYNLTQRLREITAGASASLRGQQNPYANLQSPLLNAAFAVGQQYLGNYMKFGSSTSNGAGPTVNTGT